MKLSTKIILPIILISALLILLNGCFGVPADESPGYTPGTITGVIASPCCSTSAEPVSETSGSPEYWCYYCQETWSLQDGVEVVLTYGEDEVATTTTNDKGEFTFTNVSPGKNYVVTAYCPDFEDNRPLVKDVALELIEGGSFDTKTTDLVSTSLGLVVDFLVVYTEWGPEDISLDEVLADRPSFPNFSDFKALVYEVRRVVENCELNLLTDDDVQEALCLAAEEISKLDIGCAPGFTPLPGPTPTPDPCDGNLVPIIDEVECDGQPVVVDSTVNLILGESYDIVVTAHDQDTKLGTLTYYATANGEKSPTTTSNQITVTPNLPGTFEVYVYVNDGCIDTRWGPVTVEVEEVITYTLTVGVNPADSALDVVDITPSRGAHSGYAYDYIETVSIDTTTIPAGWQFVNWTDDATPTPNILGTDPTGVAVTMDADKTVIANFVITNPVSHIVLEGFNGQTCTGSGTYDPVEPIPFDITILEWLKDGTPNFKSVHFTIDFYGVNNEISYRYTIDIDGKVWESVESGPITGDSFTSKCIELPMVPSNTWAEAFEIEIDVNGIPTYWISFRKPLPTP